MTGYYTTMMLSCLAFIADVVPKESRAFRMGIMEAITFVSGIGGQFLGGLWIKNLGYQGPFLLIFCMHMVNLTYMTCVMPESLPSDLEVNCCVVNVNHFKAAFRVFLKPRPGGRWKLCLTLIVSVLVLFTGEWLAYCHSMLHRLYKTTQRMYKTSSVRKCFGFCNSWLNISLSYKCELFLQPN